MEFVIDSLVGTKKREKKKIQSKEKINQNRSRRSRHLHERCSKSDERKSGKSSMSMQQFSPVQDTCFFGTRSIE